MLVVASSKQRLASLLAPAHGWLIPCCPAVQVRREAVRCLGLYCFLEGIPTSAASHLVVLRQKLLEHGECCAVKAAAVQVGGAGRGVGTRAPARPAREAACYQR